RGGRAPRSAVFRPVYIWWTGMGGGGVQILVGDAGGAATGALKGRRGMGGSGGVLGPPGRPFGAKEGVIIDLSGVAYMASVGIRQLVITARTLTRRGGRLVLLKPSKTVEEVLTLSMTDSLIPIARNDREAQGILAAALGG